jgi:hypothetical protein
VVNVADLRAELAACRQRREQIAADYDDNEITRPQCLAQTERRRAKMAAIEAQLAEVTEVSPLVPLIGTDDPAAAWDALNLGQHRAALQGLITVTIQPAGRGSRPDIRQRVAFGTPPAGQSSLMGTRTPSQPDRVGGALPWGLAAVLAEDQRHQVVLRFGKRRQRIHHLLDVSG